VPAIGVADGEVEVAVQPTHLQGGWFTVTGVMDPVVEGGQSDLLGFHEWVAVIVEGLGSLCYGI